MKDPTESGAFYASCGPAEGPICNNNVPGAIGVHDRPGDPQAQVGMAFCHRLIRHLGKTLMVWRLKVGGEAVPGSWVVIDRKFVDLGDWLEPLAARDERSGSA